MCFKLLMANTCNEVKHSKVMKEEATLHHLDVKQWNTLQI